MKVTSTAIPAAYEVARRGESAEIILRENIVSYDIPPGEPGGIRYDEYRMMLPWREGLESAVAADSENWLKTAKAAEYERLAAEARAERNRLLTETDHYFLLDRLLSDHSGALTPAILSGAVAGAIESWGGYRRQLRDLPDQPGFPYTVTWPDAAFINE